MMIFFLLIIVILLSLIQFNIAILNSKLPNQQVLHSQNFKKNKSPTITVNTASTETIFSLFQQSAKIEEKTLSLKSFKLAVFGLFLTVSSLTIFNVLTSSIVKGSIHNGIKDHVNELLIFDLRNGYSVTEVIKTLDSWGSSGRIKYLIIEAIDCIFYHSGYRALFVVLVNNLLQIFTNIFPKFTSFKWLGLLPIGLSYLDFIEDFCQVFFTSFYQIVTKSAKTSSIFTTAVQLGSFFNQFKWLTVKTASTLIFLILISIITNICCTNLMTKVEAMKIVK